MVYVFLANGFEEAEALVPVDILRRGGVEVKTVGVNGKVISGSHKIPVTADIELNDTSKENLEAVILPGGMPGTLNLENNPAVMDFVDFAAQKGLIIGAICAAPSILGHKGLLKGKKAICFPGFEDELYGAQIVNLPAVRDKNIITSKGAGCAFEFGLLLLEAIMSDAKKAAELRQTVQYPV